MSKPKANEILKNASFTYEAKAKEYGSSYTNHGTVMHGLFPRGVALAGVEDFTRFALVDLMVVKLVRYCVNFQKGHLDSLTDLMVYAAMLQEVDDAMLSDRIDTRTGGDNNGPLPPSGPPGYGSSRGGNPAWQPGDSGSIGAIGRKT